MNVPVLLTVNKAQAAYKIAALLVLCVAIAGCRMSVKMYLCNGFDHPVTTTNLGDAEWVKTFGVSEFPKGTCTDSKAVTHSQKQVDDARAKGTLPEVGIMVKSPSGEALARYSHRREVKPGKSVMDNPEKTYHWLMTANGIFFIPYELVNDWQAHIAQIENESPMSGPNLLRK